MCVRKGIAVSTRTQCSWLCRPTGKGIAVAFVCARYEIFNRFQHQHSHARNRFMIIIKYHIKTTTQPTMYGTSSAGNHTPIYTRFPFLLLSNQPCAHFSRYKTGSHQQQVKATSTSSSLSLSFFLHWHYTTLGWAGPNESSPPMSRHNRDLLGGTKCVKYWSRFSRPHLPSRTGKQLPPTESTATRPKMVQNPRKDPPKTPKITLEKFRFLRSCTHKPRANTTLYFFPETS